MVIVISLDILIAFVHELISKLIWIDILALLSEERLLLWSHMRNFSSVTFSFDLCLEAKNFILQRWNFWLHIVEIMLTLNNIVRILYLQAIKIRWVNILFESSGIIYIVLIVRCLRVILMDPWCLNEISVDL